MGTMCTTKSGAKPIEGTHTLDPELCSVLESAPDASIVTRNRHLEEIEGFLKARSLNAKVRSVTREKRSKADVVAEALAKHGSAEARVLFADDDWREHVKLAKDRRIEDHLSRLTRVLFVP